MVSFLKNSITTTGTERRLLRWGGIGWRLVLVLYLELSCCCKWLWKCDSRQTSRNVGYVHKSSHIWQKWRAYSGSRLGAWCRDGMGRWSTLTSLLPVVPITVVIECDVQSMCMVYALMHSISSCESGWNRRSWQCSQNLCRPLFIEVKHYCIKPPFSGIAHLLYCPPLELLAPCICPPLVLSTPIWIAHLWYCPPLSFIAHSSLIKPTVAVRLSKNSLANLLAKDLFSNTAL